MGTPWNGVPQGSILGPLLFNVSLNNIFFFINHEVIYNYADDNTLSFIHANTDVLKKVLGDESWNLIDFCLLILWKQIPQNTRQFVLEKRHMMI